MRGLTGATFGSTSVPQALAGLGFLAATMKALAWLGLVMFKLWRRYVAIACVWVIAAVTILAGGLLQGSTGAYAQGVDLGLPNPLLDSFRSGNRLPAPTWPSPAGPLYMRAWAYELEQIDKIGRGSICDRAAWERGRIRLQVLKEKARNNLELDQHNIRTEKPAEESMLARFLRHIDGTGNFDFSIFQEADLELWAAEATSRRDYIAIEGYTYPPFDCDKYILDSGGVGQRVLAPSGTFLANVSVDSQAICEFSTATPALTVLFPVDELGHSLLPISDAPASPGGPVTASNSPPGSEASTTGPTPTSKPTSPAETSNPPGDTPPSGGAPKTAGGDKPIYIGPIPPGTLPGLPKVGVSGGEYAPSPGASLEPIPTPSGDTPKTTAPGDAKKDDKPTSTDTGNKAELAAGALRQFGLFEDREIPPSVPPSLQLQTGPVVKDSILDEIEDRLPAELSPHDLDPVKPPTSKEVPIISSIAPSKPDLQLGNTVTISFKATPTAIQAGLEGKEQSSGVVMLTAAEPTLPNATKSGKTVLDKDFDKKPVKCVLDKEKGCTVQLNSAEAASLGIPESGPRNYQAFVATPNSGSGILEKLAGSVNSKPAETTPGAQITETEFTIGTQSFIQVDVVGTAAAVALVMTSYSQAYGQLFTINFCREKKLNHCRDLDQRSRLDAEPGFNGTHPTELPHGTVRLVTDARMTSAPQ